MALKLDATAVLIVTVCVGLSNFIWLPIGGAISDRIGRRPVLIVMPLLTIVTAYPLMLWLVAAPSFGKLLATVLVFSAYYGLYNGAMVPMLTEIMPAKVRTAGFSLAYSLATALFGGVTPLVSSWLIEADRQPRRPGAVADGRRGHQPGRCVVAEDPRPRSAGSGHLNEAGAACAV